MEGHAKFMENLYLKDIESSEKEKKCVKKIMKIYLKRT